MLKAYKYRIYPNKEQAVMLAKHFGCCRLIYNMSLAKKKEAYELDKSNISINDLSRDLPLLKKQEEFGFLNEVSAQSLQQVLRQNLTNAFNNFFKRVKDSSIKEKGYPKFKNRHGKQSFLVVQDIKIDFNHNKLQIPKIRNIKIKVHREFTGIIKSCTISKTCTGKYYASILVEANQPLPNKPNINEETSIGLDLGITHFLTDSNGNKIKNPRSLKNNLKRLKVLQKRLSKKQKKGQNRDKARLKVAKLHEKIANKRKDFLHKLSSKIISENQTICIEDLNISGMLRNHKLAQAISDVSWSEFIRQINYKALWRGKNVLQIGRFEPSSKMCSCGIKNDNLKLNDRVWKCKDCGITHDRDILAANNIKKFALANFLKDKENLSKTRLEQPVELVEVLSVDKSRKQEASERSSSHSNEHSLSFHRNNGYLIISN